MLKVNFKTSYYLQSKIICVPYKREKLIDFLSDLEKLFLQHDDYLLDAIAKESGISWPIKELDVFLFEGWQPSVSSPLLLNTYNYDLDFCFFNLVHELIHNNIMYVPIKDEKGNWDHVELEAIVNAILLRVLQPIFSKKQLDDFSFFAEFGGLYKYVWIRTREILSELEKNNVSFAHWFGEHYG